MAQGYTRRDTSNNINNGNIINAEDLDLEFDGIQAAMDATTGHIHDGTVGGGAPIVSVGPVQDVVITTSALRPKTDNTVDLGTTTLEFKDLYIDGIAYVDTLQVDESATIAANLTVTGNATISTNLTVNGNTTIGNAATDTITVTADVASNLIPSVDNTYDLGASTDEWRDIWIDGTATIDTLQVDESATITANLTVNGNTTLGNAATDTVTITADVASNLIPSVDDTHDLGSATDEWRNIYIDGTAQVDTLQVDESATITANLTVNGNTTLGNAATDTVTVTADVASNLIPSVDNTYDLGATGSEWKDLYITGTANIDSLVADTANISGGTITGITDLAVADGGTGASTLTGYVKGNGTSAFTASATVPSSDITGLGTMSTQNANSVAITGGSVTGITDLAVADGGTGASDASGARTNLGLGSIATQADSSVAITGGTINGTPVGATTASTIAGTTGTFSGNLTVDTNTLFVDATNNYIGINTLTPATALEVNGQASFGDGTAAAPSITNTGDLNTGIFFPAADTIAFAEGGTESARFDSSGNLCLATSAPSYDSAGRGNLTIGGANSAVLALQIGGVAKGYALHDNTNLQLINGATGAILLGTSGVERARITSDGRFYVNQTTGNGNTLQRVGVTYDGATEWAVAIKTTTASGNAISFQNSSGTQVGTISTTNSATAYVTSSDYRLKENVQPMQDALDKIAQLNPVTYTWKIDGSAGQGFIAHELQAVIPDCVTGEKDAVNDEGNPQYQGIDTSFLVATLVKAVQELTARITALEAAQ